MGSPGRGGTGAVVDGTTSVPPAGRCRVRAAVAVDPGLGQTGDAKHDPEHGKDPPRRRRTAWVAAQRTAWVVTRRTARAAIRTGRRGVGAVGGPDRIAGPALRRGIRGHPRGAGRRRSGGVAGVAPAGLARWHAGRGGNRRQRQGNTAGLVGHSAGCSWAAGYRAMCHPRNTRRGSVSPGHAPLATTTPPRYLWR